MLLVASLLANFMDMDVRGPIQGVARPPIVARQSVQAGEVSVAISPADRGPGVGKWIWSGDSPNAAVVRFRKSMLLTEAPRLARGWITAEVRYRMWVNGRLASRGPADVGRDYDSGPCGPWFEDVRDLTPFFHKGANVVAVEVFRAPLVQSDGSTGQPGLKIDLKFSERDSNVLTPGTDTTWRSAPAADLDQAGAKSGFRIDMNLEPAGWQAVVFDDRGWAPAKIANRDKPQTLVSELAPPLEAELLPLDFARVSDGVTPNLSSGGARIVRNGTYTLRYGHVLSGYVGLKVRGHKGVRLLITPNEHDAPGFNRRAEVLLHDGVQTFELPYMDSFSVINIEAEGVRYPIEIEDVRCVFTSYPVRYLGEFTCSRPDFNRIWEVSRWVTQICMQTHHLDSPHHQEPVSDAGDYLIESLNSFYAFGEGTLARQDLKKIGRTLEQRDYQSFHTSYSLLWLRMLIQYYDYTGDAEPLRELAPVAFKLLERFESYIGPHGLISEAPNYMFMDWVEIEGFNAHHPPAVIGQGYMTALYYQALADGLRIAGLVRDVRRAQKYKELRKRVAIAFEQELWVSDIGLYRDGKAFQTSVTPNQWLPADKPTQTFSTQVNALAVGCGLAPSGRATKVMQAVLARTDMNCQPYFMHFVFEAMEIAGLFDQQAEAQLQRWHIVPDSQSFLEMWNTGDLSHAWNATPLFQMSGRILGVQPVEPGFAKFQIRPHPCGLTWARGRVPTPHGPIVVSWKRKGNEIQLRFKVPPGTLAEVQGRSYLPGDHLATLKTWK